MSDKIPDDEELPYDDDEAPEDPRGEKERGFAAKMLGDMARRAIMTGIGAVFMSEESLKSQLSEMKLPKEAMNYVVGQADRTKREIVAAIARETREFLSKLEVDKVLGRALVGTTIEIQTRIRVLPKDGEAGGVETATETRMVRLDDDDKPAPKARRKRKGGEPGEDGE